MINNPNQEIHTDYKVNDIFKPVNANQLARAIHYDFVITQEMLDAYTAKYSGDTIDVGNLLSTKVDGSIAAFTAIPAPCSIYIAANTKGYKLEFFQRLFGDSSSTGHIIDITDFKDSSGQYTYEKTRDMLDVYSAYPYEITSICGGVNFWSTRTAPLTVNTIGIPWDGVCRIGNYICNEQLDFGPRSGLQVVFGNNVGGFRPKASVSAGQASTGYIPTVVFANWMNGNGTTTEYHIDSVSLSEPGLFQSVSEAYTQYSTSVTLQVSRGDTVEAYPLSKVSSTEIRFSNADIGKTVILAPDGSISWENMQGGSTASRDIIILQDDGVIVPYSGGAKYMSLDPENVTDNPTQVRYSILQNGLFTTYKTVDAVDAYIVPTSYSSSGLRPRNTTKIVWNTWYKITAYGVFDDDPVGTPSHNKDIVNEHRSVVIVADTLVEGLVYEMTINIRANAICSSSGSGGVLVDYGGMHAPSIIDHPYTLMFYTSTGATVSTYKWADTSKLGNYFVKPTFNRVPSTDTQIGFGPASGSMHIAPVLASAIVHFVKIGDKIYTMGY